MSAKETIVDYAENATEIEKWLSVKGEEKYLRFSEILKVNDIAIEWNRLKDTYRYDKRLLINVFKYMSFFEEFLRAQLWNLGNFNYGILEGKYLKDLMDMVIAESNQINYPGFSVNVLQKNKKQINDLRNAVSHNKFIGV